MDFSDLSLSFASGDDTGNPNNSIIANDKYSNERNYKEEIDHLTEINKHLKEELETLKAEFSSSVNVIPNMENLYTENYSLKKSLMEMKELNDDLQKRLEIALQTNNEITNSKKNSKTTEIKNYEAQISELQIENGSLKAEIDNIKSSHQRQTKHIEANLHSIQSENSVLSSNVSKILKAAEVRFNNKFQSATELFEFLKKPPTETKPKTANSRNEELEQKCALLNDKVDKLQEKLQNEKQKVKTLQIGVIKLKKKCENDALKNEQELTSLNDSIKQKDNEIQRLTILNQQKLIVKPPPKTRNQFVQVSTIIEDTDSEQLRRELSSVNAKLHDEETTVSMLKMDLENVKSQLRESEIIKAQISAKLKTVVLESERLQTDLHKQQKENQKLAKDAEEALTKLSEKSNESNLPIERLEGEIARLKLKENNDEKTIDTLERLLNDQKTEITDLSNTKEILIGLIEKQSQIFIQMDNMLQHLEREKEKLSKQRLKEDDRELSDDRLLKNLKGNQNNSGKWDFGDLPNDILDIVTEISENDSLTVDSRVKSIFTVVNRYIDNQANAHRKEKESHEKDVNYLTNKYESFKAEIIEALQDGNEEEILNNNSNLNTNSNLNEYSNVSSEKDNKEPRPIDPEKAADLISRYIMKCRKLINQVTALQSDKNEFLKKIGIDDYESVISSYEDSQKMIEKLASQIKDEKKKRNVMRQQVKKVISNKEKESETKTNTLKKMNDISRKQISQLQSEIEKLQEQNKSLIEQLRNICQPKKPKEDSSSNSSFVQNNDHEDEEAILQRSREQNQMNFQIEELNGRIESLDKAVTMWKQVAQKAQEEVSNYQKKLNDLSLDYEDKMNSLQNVHEMEKDELRNKINEVDEKLHKETQKHKLDLQDLADTLQETQNKLDNATTELNKLKFEIEKNNMNSASKIESIERSKKLSEAQLKAQILSINSNYSIQILEEKQRGERAKRNLIEFFVKNFKDFVDVHDQLDENCFKEMIRIIKLYLEKCQNTENAIRKLIKANDDESTEDALTQFIIRMHPQFRSQ